MARSSLVSGGGPPLAILIPALAGLVALGLLIGLIGGQPAQPSAPRASGSPLQVVAGEPSGAVVFHSSLTGPAPSPTPSATATPSTRPTPTEQPAASVAPSAGGFKADVVVCRSLSGSRCHGRFTKLPPGASSFWMLIQFEHSRRGDVIGTHLRGPGGDIATPSFTVKGGDGYAWASVSARHLKPGRYTLSVDHNGTPAADTSFTVR